MQLKLIKLWPIDLLRKIKQTPALSCRQMKIFYGSSITQDKLYFVFVNKQKRHKLIIIYVSYNKLKLYVINRGEKIGIEYQ